MNFQKEHFPSVSKHLDKIASTSISSHGQLTDDVCQLIESHLGRLIPLILSQKEFESRPDYYKRKITNGDHLTEVSSSSLMIKLMQQINKIEKRTRARPISPAAKRARRHSSPELRVKSLHEKSSQRNKKESEKETPLDKPRESTQKIDKTEKRIRARSKSPAATRARLHSSPETRVKTDHEKSSQRNKKESEKETPPDKPRESPSSSTR